MIDIKKNNKNYRIKNVLLNQKGMALLTTLIFVFILSTFAVALLTMTSNDTKLSALQRDSTQAFYLSEAGIQKAIKELNADFNWRTGFTDVLLGSGTYTVVIEDQGDDPAIPLLQVRVTSTGTVLNSKRRIKIFVKSDFPPIIVLVSWQEIY